MLPWPTPATEEANATVGTLHPHEFPALESMLPDLIAGVQVTKLSIVGEDTSDPSSLTTQLLATLDKDGSDFAVAYTFDPTGAILDQSVIAVMDVDGTELLEAWLRTFGTPPGGFVGTCHWRLGENGEAVLFHLGDDLHALIPRERALLVLRAWDIASLESVVASVTAEDWTSELHG